jgi:hypothetical protein
MRKMILQLVCAAVLTGCSAPPKAPQPTGEWKPVNKPLSVKE